jgi:catalase
VAEELAQAVAQGIGMTELPGPLPRLSSRTPKAEIERSPPLSLLARPGEEGIKTRKVAILIAAGVDAAAASHVHAALAAQADSRYLQGALRMTCTRHPLLVLQR